MSEMVIPEGWLGTSIGALSKVKRGASPRPIKDPKWWGGSVGWTRISDVTSSVKYLNKTTDYLSKEGVAKSVRIPKGEVILSICATIGRPVIVNADACIHDGFVWFDGLSRGVDREFYYYFLSSKEESLSASRQTGTQGNLNTDIVSRLEISLPPLPEQQKIAAILTSVDDVIEKTQAQIDKLQDLKKGTMNELLTKGIGHTEFKESPVGMIPVEWESKTLSSLVEKKYGIVDGPFGSNLKTEHYKSSGVPVIQSGFVTAGKFSAKKYVHVDEEKYQEQIRSSTSGGDIVMAKIGANAGACAMLPYNHPIGILAGNSLKMTLCQTVAATNFIILVLHYYRLTGELDRIKTETAQPAISISSLRKLQVPVPNLAEQQNVHRQPNRI